jgi:hypothetical protein
MIAAVVMLTMVASAQQAKPSPPAMVLPNSGGALSVETIAKYVTKDPDGTSTSGIEKTKVYRDAAGRLRSEMEVRDAFGGPVLAIILADPVEGNIVVLETLEKIAHRLKGGPGGRIGTSIGPIGLITVSGKKTQKTETLGKQTIEGIEFEGIRTTTTSNEQPSLVALDDVWKSKELGLFGLVKHSGPDGEMTSRIQNVDRTVPDPALFVIPADYRIREMEPPGPPQ